MKFFALWENDAISEYFRRKSTSLKYLCTVSTQMLIRKVGWRFFSLWNQCLWDFCHCQLEDVLSIEKEKTDFFLLALFEYLWGLKQVRGEEDTKRHTSHLRGFDWSGPVKKYLGSYTPSSNVRSTRQSNYEWGLQRSTPNSSFTSREVHEKEHHSLRENETSKRLIWSVWPIPIFYPLFFTLSQACTHIYVHSLSLS